MTISFKLRSLSLVLALLIVLLPACADKAASTDAAVTEAATEAETEPDLYPDDLDDSMNFDGYSVRFISANETVSIALKETDDTADIINEAIWKRNQTFTDRLNADIELCSTTGYDTFNAAVGTSINAAADDYDVFCGHTRFNISIAASGYLKNLSNIENLNFSKSYWSGLYIDNVNYKDALYWATGDLTFNFIAYIYALFVNSKLWNDNFSGTDIYDIVLDGGWTLDTLDSYASICYSDINGDGKQDDGDSYGFVMQKGHVLNGMFFASGVEYTSADENGDYFVSLNNEHTIEVFDRLHALFYEKQYCRMLDNAPFDTTAPKMFTEGRLLFCPNTFGFCTGAVLRAMEDDFYIVPLPKFDEAQESYRVNQYDGVPIYGIPVTVPAERSAMLGAALEVMCSLSSQLVTPVYYDLALKNKYSRDEKTAEMLDLIHDHVTADFSFAWGDTIGSVMNIFYDNIQNTSVSSSLASYEKAWPKKMTALCEKLEANIEN